MVPPRSPGPGPMSIRRSAASITAGSCSDHHQRVAGIAQALHGLDDAVHVARVQSDAGLVEHEHGVDQRGAQRRGQVDALHLAAAERAALAIQRQVADADVAQVFEPRADLVLQQRQRLVGGRSMLEGQRERIEENRRRRSIGISIRSCRSAPAALRAARATTARPPAGMKRFGGAAPHRRRPWRPGATAAPRS